jgi:hypothetical protein
MVCKATLKWAARSSTATRPDWRSKVVIWDCLLLAREAGIDTRRTFAGFKR